MTVVFSSSSPVASAALIDAQGRALAATKEEAKGRASGILIQALDALLKGSGLASSDVTLFVADVGPGSFTGVRVGVMLAKALAFELGIQVAGVPSFDLVSPEGLVVVPSRKGESYLRTPGSLVSLVNEVPAGARGYGPGVARQEYPMAANAGPLLAALRPVAPEALVPTYVSEPSISKPRDPRVLGGPHA